MRLRFIGQDGLMGFKAGKIYKLEIHTDGGYIWIKSGILYGCYASLSAFCRNWQDEYVEDQE